MLPGLKVFHRGLILVGVPFVLELVLIVCLSVLLYQSDQDQLKESTYRKIAACNARLLVLTSETPYYLVSSIRFGSDEIFHVYQNKHDQICKNQEKLIRLLKKTPDLSDGAGELQENIDHVLKFTEDIAAARKGNLPELLNQLGKVISTFDSEKNSTMEHLAKMLRAGEIRTKEMEDKQARIRRQQSLILSGGILANLVAGVLLALFFRHGIAQRLGTIRQNTIALTANNPLAKPLSGSDEIAQLDQAFHTMDRDLKQAAARGKELFDNASDVICVLDYNNKFVKVNLASRRVWGYPPDKLLLLSLSQILHVDDQNPLLDHVARGKLTAEPFTFENRIITQSGTEIETSWSAFWSQIDRQLYCVVHDITERKRTERMKRKFLSMISSDLKKPLSAMSGAVAILVGALADNLPKNAVEKLNVAGKNLQRLLGLVNDLLQVAEMESTSIDVKKEWCDTEEPLIRSVQEVEAVANKQGVKLEVQACQVQWLVDPNRIVQVLVNLLSNAIKFSPQGETVTLSAEERGDMIEVKVRDRGRGVPEAYREAIFEKFKQVEAADGKRKSGTGLGLPICKQIVEEHGGSIGVESAEGQGSSFWFLIPRDETVSLKIKLQKKRKEQKEASEPGTEAGANAAMLTAQQAEVARAKEKKQAVSGRIKLGYKGVILVGVPLVFELALVGALSLVLFQVDHERKEELYYRNIAFQTSRLINMYFMMAVGAISESGEKDWLIFRGGYDTAKKTLNELDRALKLKNDKVGLSHLATVYVQDKKFEEWVERGDKRIQEEGKSQAIFRDAMGGKEKMLPYMMKIAKGLEKLCDDSEKKEFVSPERQKTLRYRQAQILFFGLLVNIAGSLALAKFFSSDITSRLQILADNAMRLAKEKELNLPLIGSDEIAELDRIFHETARALDEARKKERAVFDNSQDVICALSTEGSFRSVNPAAETMWGYTKDELAGKNLAEIVAGDDHKLLDELLQVGVNQHNEFELQIKKKDDSLIHVLWSYSRAAEQGDILCVVRDISNIKELERIRQEFLGMVSHDLRTPLTSILGITKLILAGAFGKIEERPSRLLDRISKSGDQLLELINDLLDIEKLEAGKMQLLLEEVKLPDLLNKSIAAARDTSRVVLNNAASSELSFKADQDRLQQAIVNVLNHALDRTPAESSVTLSIMNRDNLLVITVKDSADALTEKALKSLFDRFQNVTESSPADSQEPSGTGLALPIAKKIIESHGGSIAAAASDKGNAITMQVPVNL